jgi:Lar family restriction alleviation protein
MSETLLPCPFCGSQAKDFYIYDGYDGTDIFSVECGNKRCWVTLVAKGRTRKKAAKAWNKRVPIRNKPGEKK